MKAVVSISGGPDSTVCLAMAVEEHGPGDVKAVSFEYGQRHGREVQSAANIANFYGVEHRVLDLSEIYRGGSCALLVSGSGVPDGSYAEQMKKQGHLETEVPFRNGLMMAALAAMSDNEQAEVWLGAHADDSINNAYAYPDCSPVFIRAFAEALNLGTSGRVALRAPLISLTKAEVIAKGLELGVPFELTWSCYKGGDEPCGICGACIARARAFDMNGVPDPALEVK